MREYTVLIIEDNDDVRKSLSKIIKKEGYRVITAKNGKEGLNNFNKIKPEIVITDLKMPGMDGMEVIHKIKTISPITQVILITAYGELDIAVKALREGVIDYLKKPVELDAIYLALGRAREKISEYEKIYKFPVPTILLVDDDKIIRKACSKILKKEKWNVLTAPDGEKAIEIFRKKKIDIILLDIRMPGKDGIQTLHEMRNISKDFEAIILTGYGDESSATQALRDGAYNFLKKPIDIDQLITFIDKATNKLNTDRILKYRIRDISLQKQIMAIITSEKDIIIDVREFLRKPAKKFALDLLNALPFSIAVIDDEMKIRLVNDSIIKALKYQPETLNQKFIKDLSKIGFKNISYPLILKSITDTFNKQLGTIKIINTGKYSHFKLVLISLINDIKNEKVIIMIFSGERK